jgi:hypothetical protein
MPENASASPALPGHIFSPADIPAEVSGSLRERETERKKGGEEERERTVTNYTSWSTPPRRKVG